MPSLVAVFLNHFDGDSIEFEIPEEIPQVFQLGAMATHCGGSKSSEVRAFELLTQLSERNPLALPPDLEQSQRDFSLAMLPNLIREDFAGRLGRFVMVFAAQRVAHPPKT
ncbi:MAG: hypothetical protein WA823_14830 [Candidatus Acidiferrales bacterium]